MNAASRHRSRGRMCDRPMTCDLGAAVFMAAAWPPIHTMPPGHVVPRGQRGSAATNVGRCAARSSTDKDGTGRQSDHTAPRAQENRCLGPRRTQKPSARSFARCMGLMHNYASRMTRRDLRKPHNRRSPLGGGPLPAVMRPRPDLACACPNANLHTSSRSICIAMQVAEFAGIGADRTLGGPPTQKRYRQ